MAEQKIGIVIHYWGKVGVAGVKVTDGEQFPSACVGRARRRRNA